MAESYGTFDSWRRYLPFVPERFRFHDDQAPREQWWSWRDAGIHLDVYEVATPPATVLLLHGGGGYGRMLFPLAVALRRMGYRVVAPDLPGYGLSRVRRNQIDYRAWVDCASELLQEESRRTGKPVVPFGLSMGGYLGYLVAARTREAGAVIATGVTFMTKFAVASSFLAPVLLLELEDAVWLSVAWGVLTALSDALRLMRSSRPQAVSADRPARRLRSLSLTGDEPWLIWTPGGVMGRIGTV